MRPLRALAFVTVFAGASFSYLACGPKVPTIPQQASVASYTAALEACLAAAHSADAGRAEKEAQYERCRDQVDGQYGRAPEARDAGGDQ